MKKEIKYLTVFLIIYTPFLFLNHPLKKLLTNYGVSELKSEFISVILVLIPLLITLIWLMGKLNFKRFNGIKKGMKMEKPKFLFIPLLFLIFVLVNNFNRLLIADIHELLLFSIFVLLVGFTEEFLFRGILLPFFITKFKDKKYSLSLGIFLSSIAFGLIHFVNLINNPSNLVGITIQVAYAFCLGVLFSGLLLKTQSILIPSLIHALVNLKGTISLLGNKRPTGISEQAMRKLPDGIIWDFFVQELPFNILLLFGGYVLVRKINMEEVLKKLNVNSTTANNI